MKLFELVKKARDDDWSDEKIELEVFKWREDIFKSMLEELNKLK